MSLTEYFLIPSTTQNSSRIMIHGQGLNFTLQSERAISIRISVFKWSERRSRFLLFVLWQAVFRLCLALARLNHFISLTTQRGAGRMGSIQATIKMWKDSTCAVMGVSLLFTWRRTLKMPSADSTRERREETRGLNQKSNSQIPGTFSRCCRNIH